MLVKVKDIHKSYGNVKVLKGVSIEIAKSEIISIEGASGAGKTTLLQILGTLETPDQGTVEINEVPVHQLKGNQLSAFRNQKIGFVFQFHNLLPEFTALENVCLPGMIANTPKLQLETRAKELLDYLGLSSRFEHKPSELSGGEQQRVAVARALINNPALVLADEPTGNLDSENAKELHNVFFRLRKEFGQTFIIVTHNAELASLSDRSIRISDGVVV
ncbi:MAG: ABC transporter ATP-binding protein [Bacteroidota bacterium]|jgi:lipoprotein-releasing system ATP-binding protein